MLVYGDHSECTDPRDRIDNLSVRLKNLASMSAGLERHAYLITALIEAGRLLQGIADAGVLPGVVDDFVHALAGCAVTSFDSGMRELGALPLVPETPLPNRLELRVPEGFAFYSVYPESYMAAARRLKLLGPPLVIGIRSIGTTLGAVVAAALGAPRAISVRPSGNPFARQVELPTDIPTGKNHYIIVDEGPGLSGSSFGAVADWLQQRGVPLERIAFLPSHKNEPGAEAAEAHRWRWRQAQRVAAEFDPGFLADRFGPLKEFASGGPWQRRKYLAGKSGERLLLKFAGLGAIGESKLALARALHAAGLISEPLELCHGFLIERWHEDAVPLPPHEKPVKEIGRYIGERARLFPAPDASGATISELLTMCRRNIGLALGNDAASALDRFEPNELQARVKPVRTDNKLDREEWLRLPGGRLLKTDALDHHQAHDLIGCQDAAWDIAGAIVEFGLDERERGRLIAASEVAVDQHLLEFYHVAYAAFRRGQAVLGAEMLGSNGQLKEACGRYRHALDLLLHQELTDCDSVQILD